MIGCNKKKLKINVHKSIEYNVTVRSGFLAGGDVLTPENNGVYLVDAGIYNILFEAEGYCSQEHLILIEETKFRNNITLDIHPIKLQDTAAEFKGPMFYLPDAFEKALYEDEVSRKADAFCFKTPAFDENKSELQFTTSKEFGEFVEHIAGNCSFIKVFSEEAIPIVLISEDASRVSDDIRETVKQIRGTDKLKVFYQAQVHGTEPASGEGALTFIAEAAEGRLDDLLVKMDIFVMPCCNPVGTDNFERDLNGININRDALSLKCRETETLHDLFIALMPEVTIDAHTFTRANGISSPYLDRSLLDVRLSPAYSRNIDKSINTASGDIAKETLRKLRKEGIRSGYYGDSADPSTSRVFYGLFNTCSFLLESEGTGSGKLHFRRNVWSQFTAVITLLNVICERASFIKAVVSEARNKMKHIGIKKGNASEEHDVFVVKHGKSDKYFFKTQQANYDLNGNVIDEENVIYFPKRSVALEKTVRPRGYRLLKGKKDTELLVGNLIKNGAEVIETPDEYIVYTNQLASNIISTLLEPLSGDAEYMIKQDK